MRCPFCQAEDTKVTDSRLATDGAEVRRRRVCPVCNERFTTYEVVEVIMPRVVKRDGSRVTFDENKLRNGMLHALEKRPVSTEKLDQALKNVMRRIRATGDKEVASQQIGEWVMDELKALDDVAYVRFASVYRRFQDLDAFRDEIEKLIKKQNKNK
jgi:transcriptional repressor NrdR